MNLPVIDPAGSRGTPGAILTHCMPGKPIDAFPLGMHTMRRRYWFVLSLLLNLTVGLAHGQYHARFDVALDLDLQSAEQTLALYQGLSGFPSQVARLRGSQVALATTSYLAQRPLDLTVLEQSLQAAKFNQDLGDDVFQMQNARQNARLLQDLLSEMRTKNFAQRVVRTVEQLFPAEARVATRIPVFVVAFGHQNIDAFVRRVLWKENTPVFVGEGQGQLTIVVNLAKATAYGSSTEERFVALLGVVAHEVFHAAFGVYKDNTATWRQYYASSRRPLDTLFDLTHNEGIAYYLSLVENTRGRLTPEWERRVRAAFVTFNANAEELLSPTLSLRRAQDIIRMSNTSGFWESYGAVTGMIIARQIDQAMGRNGLVETIVLGPNDFFAKYVKLMRQDSNLPPLSPALVNEVSRLAH